MTESPRISRDDLLSGRVRAHRHRHLRALSMGLGVAIVLHIGVLVLNPTFESADLSQSRSPTPLELSLPRPSDVEVPGRPASDLPEWPVVLTNYAQARIAIHQLWPRAYRRAGEGGSVALRLTLSGDGVVEAVEMVEGTGDLSKDEAFTQLAWLFRFRLDVGDLTAERASILQRVQLSPREGSVNDVR